MIIKTDKPSDVLKAKNHFDKLINKNCQFELKEIRRTRTALQNSALHLFFRFIKDELNELGLTFKYQGLNNNILECRYTELIVKERIWKPIQETLFGEKSTTKLTTKQLDEVVDVIVKWLGDKGVVLQFPSIETLIENKQ